MARREVADERRCLSVRHADPSDAGIHTNVDRDRTAETGGDAIEIVADRGIDHGHDAARREIGQLPSAERSHQ